MLGVWDIPTLRAPLSGTFLHVVNRCLESGTSHDLSRGNENHFAKDVINMTSLGQGRDSEVMSPCYADVQLSVFDTAEEAGCHNHCTRTSAMCSGLFLVRCRFEVTYPCLVRSSSVERKDFSYYPERERERDRGGEEKERTRIRILSQV